jgi:hypothetical protein
LCRQLGGRLRGLAHQSRLSELTLAPIPTFVSSRICRVLDLSCFCQIVSETHFNEARNRVTRIPRDCSSVHDNPTNTNGFPTFGGFPASNELNNRSIFFGFNCVYEVHGRTPAHCRLPQYVSKGLRFHGK